MGSCRRPAAVFVVWIALCVAQGIGALPATPHIVNGVMDLRDWDFARDGTVVLTGDWRFNWNVLLPPEGTPPRPGDPTLALPAPWNGHSAGATKLKPFGFGTYQLTLRLPPGHPTLDLDLPEINMNYELWANGKFLTGLGAVGTTPESSVPKSRPQAVTLPPDADIHLVMLVSNFYHFEGGVTRPIKLDRRETVLASAQHHLLVNAFSIGALFFLGLHYLVIYLNERQGRESLLYAALALVFLCRLIVVNQLTYLVFDHPHIYSTRLSYTVIFLLPGIYLLFLRELFPGEVSKPLARIMFVIGVTGTVVIWMTPAYIFTLSRDVWTVVIQVVVIYAIGCVALAAYRKREDSFIVLGIVAILGSTIIYDTLVYQRVFYANDISPYGFLVFIFGHAAILGRRANRAFVRERVARQDLAELSANLQARVDERTADLSNKVGELEAQERELQAARTTAELTNSAKSRFLAAASHDLRQPLHALNLFVETLGFSIGRGNWQGVVSQMGQSLKSLDSLLEDLGDVSRIESGALVPLREDIPVQGCIDQLRAEFEVLCAEKGLDLRIVPTSLWVNTDVDMFERILRNLLSNAVKYTTRGGVLVGCRRVGDRVRVEVYDTGPGIDPADLELIFEEFYRPEVSKDTAPGAGLGLSIVKHLAELLGHEIAVTSTPGRGTRFAITLPRSQLSEQPARSRRDQVTAPDLAGTRILFVDDDETVRVAMDGAMKAWGCVVVCADSVGDAVARLEGGFVPELLVTDFHLRAGETGLDVLAHEEASVGRIPAIFITAESAPERLAQVESQGHPVLFKPVDVRLLRETIARLVSAQAEMLV